MPSDLPSIGRLQIARASGLLGVGKYRIFASLGRGGMADVQLAAARGPKGFNKLVVVKRLRPLLAEDAAVVNMFLDEARLAARLNHPNLIHTYEFGEEHGTYFIAMEFLEGQPLHEVIHALRSSKTVKPASPQVWAKIIADALAGLHYAHELHDYDGTPLNVVHRDVSPQNIVVTYDGGVKLVDFGIAKASVNASKTESQVIKGKLAYMAPEQADPDDGSVLDRRADIFAMGIVLWECLAGKRLATGDARAVISKIVDMEFQAPSLLNPDVPPELDAITRRALERSPEDRYQTAQAMREALERFLRTQGDIIDETTIGKLVTGLFAREREDLQRQIRVQMSDLHANGDLTVADSTPSQRVMREKLADAAPAPPYFGPAPGPLTESVASLRAVRTSVTSEARGARGWRGPALGIGALLVLFVGAFLSLGRPGARTDGASGAQPSASSPPPLTSDTMAAPAAPSGSPSGVASAAPTAAPPASAAAGAPRDAGAPSARPSAPPPLKRPPRAAPPQHQPKLDSDPWR